MPFEEFEEEEIFVFRKEINSDSFIRKITEKTLYSDANIFEMSEVTLNSDASIKYIDNTETLNSDGNILKVIDNTLNSDAFIHEEQTDSIASDSVVTRINKVVDIYVEVDGSNTIVYGDIPETLDAKTHIEVDINGSVYSSDADGGFEYWDGDSWESYPSVGLNSYFGNQFRYKGSIVPSGLVKVRGFAK